MKIWALTIVSLLLLTIQGGSAEQCGRQAGGALCPGGLCCSEFGWCGDTSEYCNDKCQSQCGSSPGGGGLGGLISRATFDNMLKHRNDGACPARNFYTYDAFISAAKAFPGFGTTGDDATKKREIAAFLAQTSHETTGRENKPTPVHKNTTCCNNHGADAYSFPSQFDHSTGGWPTAPDGPHSWGYCFVRERNPPSDYCRSDATYPCAPGRQYYGRGPMQLSWNYNYGQCGRAIGVDLLNNPDLVATDPVISFKAAIWFWMTPQSPKPSCHDVITGRWNPSGADQAAGRVPGYGVTTNIINGGLECGKGRNDQVEDRIGFFKRYCDIFRIGYGNNLDCYNQRPWGNGLFQLDAVM